LANEPIAGVKFSRRATADLLRIGSYTLKTWGPAQAARYLDGLEKSTGMLARNPGLGRTCDWIRPGLHRFEHERHVIFYRRIKRGIRVIRILHQRMLPGRHRFEDENRIG
jgi:toxin ParE1/3/4